MPLIIGLNSVHKVVEKELLKKGIDERVSLAMDVEENKTNAHKIGSIELPLCGVYRTRMSEEGTFPGDKKVIPVFYSSGFLPNAMVVSEHLHGFAAMCQYQLIIKENAVYYRHLNANPGYIEELLAARITENFSKFKGVIKEGIHYMLDTLSSKNGTVYPAIILDQKVEKYVTQILERNGLKKVKK